MMVMYMKNVAQQMSKIVIAIFVSAGVKKANFSSKSTEDKLVLYYNNNKQNW